MRYSLLLLLLVLQTSLRSQDSSAGTIRELLELAEKNYPLIRSKNAEVASAKAAIKASAITFIPTLDGAYQVNYGTYNNITGMNYPQYLIPISGPPSADNRYSGVFGSAAGLLLNWQPVTFGYRQSQVEHARAGYRFATAEAGNELFRHKIQVIDAWLQWLTAQELEKVFLENVKRAETGLTVVRTLVTNGLKPGVDSAMLKAELSGARVQLLNSLKMRELAEIQLKRLVAISRVTLKADSLYFHRLPSITSEPDYSGNPMLQTFTAQIDLGKARKTMLNKTKMPVLGVWGTAYARGSGIDFNGNVKSAEGLGFQRYNYGLGFQLSIPILQSFRLKPQILQQDFLIESAKEKLNEIHLYLNESLSAADTEYRNALAIAAESPSYYESASFSYRALLSRYESGLANYADLAQSMFAMVKADIERRTSYMQVWKALLQKAAVSGDLELFLNQVK